MAIQNKILQRKATVTTEGGQTLTVAVGALALGKPGDIISRAYGPVVRSGVITADNGADFGSYVSGKGILVNSDDCAGAGTKFETVKKLNKGEVGSFLVSGACVVKPSQISAINTGMKVQALEDGTPFSTDDWKPYANWAAATAYKVGDIVMSSTKLYVCTTAHTSGESIDSTKFGAAITPHGSSAAFSEFGDYSYAYCLVTKDSATYTNPVAIDSVVTIEVNGFETEAA